MTLVKDPLVESVIGCAIEVHRTLGPGLLETAYVQCFCRELKDKGISFRTEVTIPVQYKGVNLECAYRVDVLVEDWLVIEIKSVERIMPIHTAQVLTYVKLLGARQGLIINFNAPRLKDGLKSVIAREALQDQLAVVRDSVTHEG